MGFLIAGGTYLPSLWRRGGAQGIGAG